MSVRIDELFDAFVNNLLGYVRTRCREYQPVPDAAKVQALIRVFASLLEEYELFDRFHVQKLKSEEVQNRLDMLFLYAAIWTLAGSVDQKGRDTFHKFIRTAMREPAKCDTKRDKLVRIDKSAVVPDGGQSLTVYDYFVERGDCRWRRWREHLESPEIAAAHAPGAHVTYTQLVLPTVEMLRVQDHVARAVANKHPFLLMGPTGTGKSTYVNRYLKALPLEGFNLVFVHFSAQTSAESTQEIVDTRLDKRRKGVYGPKLGMRCLVFVDDVNMPQLDKYGAQPPIELLRQFLDHKGWYARDRTLMEIIDTVLLAAMGPPSGGRNAVSARFLRHFNVLACVESSEQELLSIYTRLMQWHLTTNEVYN